LAFKDKKPYLATGDQEMEKVFKILVVFVLLMLLIIYFIRSRERKFREYVFSHRIPDSRDVMDEMLLLDSIISHEGAATITDRDAGLVYVYHISGMLTIFRQGAQKEVQRLAVPANGYFLSFDPVKEELYLHHEGEIYVYIRRGA
jgi:hypothetical protein